MQLNIPVQKTRKTLQTNFIETNSRLKQSLKEKSDGLFLLLIVMTTKNLTRTVDQQERVRKSLDGGFSEETIPCYAMDSSQRHKRSVFNGQDFENKRKRMNVERGHDRAGLFVCGFRTSLWKNSYWRKYIESLKERVVPRKLPISY